MTATNNIVEIGVLQHTVLVMFLCASVTAVGADISGTVTNKTIQKPAAGDDVILLSLSQGMQETARTKTDTRGRFKLQVPDEGVQHLVRVVHQGVNYHKPVPQGTSTVEVEVYDVAQQVDKIFGEGRIFRVQTANGQLQVSEMYILRNESTPPRTRMSERSFEVVVPDGAEIERGMAAGPGGMPVTSAPVPTDQKSHYAFIFPIRPGRTQLQISYHLPYKGSYAFTFRPDMSFAEIGVMLPKSMNFKATGDAFQPAADESGMTTYVAKGVSTGQAIAFTVSGEGSAPNQDNAGATASGAPGGGLGAPVASDNPMSGKTTWYVLGGLMITLASVAYFVARRPVKYQENPAPVAVAAAAATGPAPATVARPLSAPVKPANSGSKAILELLKEELFQIETERLEGKLSEQQYSHIKAGIDALMRRHVGKNS